MYKTVGLSVKVEKSRSLSLVRYEMPTSCIKETLPLSTEKYDFAVFGEVFSALPKVLYAMGKVNRAEGVILYLVLDTLVTAAGLGVVDHWMPSVAATDKAIVAVSLLFALPGLGDFGKEKK